MRTGRRQLSAWVAMAAIASQAILFVGPPPVAAFDAVAVICHSGAPDPASDQPAPVDPDCCAHCVLCKTGTAADVPRDGAMPVWQPLPVRVAFQFLTTRTPVERPRAASARAPPRVA